MELNDQELAVLLALPCTRWHFTQNHWDGAGLQLIKYGLMTRRADSVMGYYELTELGKAIKALLA